MHPLRHHAALLFLILIVVLLDVHIAAASMCECAHRFDLLMEFFHATNGTGWANQRGWGGSLSSSSCNLTAPGGGGGGGDWYGVNCSGGDVTAVILPSNNLAGTLPSSWLNMSNLTSLQLYSNSLRGTLPASWSKMTSIVLQLQSNVLVGKIPSSWVASTTTLQQLSLQGNCLTGRMPSVSSASLRVNNAINVCRTKIKGAAYYAATCPGSAWPQYCRLAASNSMSESGAGMTLSETSSVTVASRSAEDSNKTRSNSCSTMSPSLSESSTSESFTKAQLSTCVPARGYLTLGKPTSLSAKQEDVCGMRSHIGDGVGLPWW